MAISEQAKARAATLWRFASEAYGRAWTREYGHEPPAMWRRAMEEITDGELRRGLAGMAAGEWTYPPNCGLFVRYCVGRVDRPAEQAAFYARIEQDEQRALPAPGEVFERSRKGRAWLAFLVLDGQRPMPKGWTEETVREMLQGHDVDAMRASHGAAVDATRRSLGAT